MAHPMRDQARSGHNAKMRAMTKDYGSANASMTKNAPVDILKSEGPEDVSGFGSDSSAAKPRSDRPARKSVAANPLATYKSGGKVKGRAWGGMMGNRPGAPQMPNASGVPTLPGNDMRPAVPSPITQGPIQATPIMRPSAPTGTGTMQPFKKGGSVKMKMKAGDGSGVGNRASGGKVVNRADGGDVSAIEEANRDQSASNRARGGRTGHKKGSTHVNVIVAPQGGGNTPPMVPHPMIPPQVPPRPPMAGPPPSAPGMPPGAPPMGGPPVMPPGMPPPGMMPPRASGGRIEQSMKAQGLVRKDKPSKMPLEGEAGGRARGGMVTGYDAGALSGEGRLEKIANYGRKTARAKPQTV